MGQLCEVRAPSVGVSSENIERINEKVSGRDVMR